MVEPDDVSRLIEIFPPIQQVDLTNEILKDAHPTMRVFLRASYEISGVFFWTLLLWAHEMLTQTLVVGAADSNANPVGDRPLVVRFVQNGSKPVG